MLLQPSCPGCCLTNPPSMAPLPKRLGSLRNARSEKAAFLFLARSKKLNLCEAPVAAECMSMWVILYGACRPRYPFAGRAGLHRLPSALSQRCGRGMSRPCVQGNTIRFRFLLLICKFLVLDQCDVRLPPLSL